MTVAKPEQEQDPNWITIDRPIYPRNRLQEKHAKREIQVSSKEALIAKWKRFSFKHLVLGFFPFIDVLKNYNIKHDLPRDLAGGLTAGIMCLPQGMAYGMLASLAPVYGLYVTFYPPLIYFFLGTSKHVSVGIFAVVALLVGNVLDEKTINFVPKYSSPDIDNNTLNGTTTTEACVGDDCLLTYANDELLQEKLAIAAALTLMVGIVQLVLGTFKLGVIAVYLSQPVVKGFTTGSACHVFTSQLTHIFGIKVKRHSGLFKLVYTWIEIFSRIVETNFAALITTIICVTILYIVKEYVNTHPKLKKYLKMPIPIELIIVVLATIVSHFAKLNEKYELRVVGPIPRGFPAPKLPESHRMLPLIGDAIAIAIVAFATTVSIGKLLAKKHGYQIVPNQELFALGSANVFTCFFSGFACSAALARSMVQESVGAQTLVSSLFSCLLVMTVILAAGPLFRNLPNAALASIILVALKKLFMQLEDLKRLWPISKIDFGVWLVTFLSTAILDVTYGLGIGVIAALSALIVRAQRTNMKTLAQIEGTEIYVDKNQNENVEELPGLKILRYEDSIHFANFDKFRNSYKLQTQKPSGKDKTDSATASHHTTILDCSRMSFLDSVGITGLTQLVSEEEQQNIKVLLAGCSEDVYDCLDNGGFIETHGNKVLFMTVHDAVVSAQRSRVKVASNGVHNESEKLLTPEIEMEIMPQDAVSQV